MLSYEEVVSRLEALGIMPTTLPSLAPMTRALQRCGYLDGVDPRRNIIIAGTNGKGSVAATLSALLRSAGQSVGLYTSPHLCTTRERIRVNGENVSETLFVEAYEAVLSSINDERLTHFEALTLMAAAIFYSGKFGPAPDWVIWEVGLGGTFDATNAIPHHYCAITKLGLDHENLLGSSLELIARQKFGVIGKGAEVVYSPMPESLTGLRLETEQATGCRWWAASAARLVGAGRLATEWGETALALCGQRAAENSATALTLFEVLGFAPAQHLGALAQVDWPGRFSRVRLPGFLAPVFLSGDHNVQGIESLLEILGTLTWRSLHLVVGVCADKNSGVMFELLKTLPRLVLHLTETPVRTLPLTQVPRHVRAAAGFSDKDVFRVLAAIQGEASAADLVVVTGSLYLVGSVLQSLDRN